jgi:mannitol-1-phosphate/altronate dehydrogenase
MNTDDGLWEALTMDQLLSQFVGVSDTTASNEALDAVKSWSESVIISFIIVNQWEEKGIIYCTTQQTTKHDSESYLQKHIATGFKKEYVKKECEQVCMQVSCKHSSHIVLLCHHHFQLENRDGWNLNEKVIQQYKYIGFGRGKLTIERTHNKENSQ